MFRSYFKSNFANLLLLLLTIVFCVILFDKSTYTDEEIAWCKQYKPFLPIVLCSYYFGE